MKRLLACLVMCSCLGPLAACGGGGGGNGDVEGDGGLAPQILGPYHYFELVSGSTAFRFTEVGPAEVDETGLLTGETERYSTFLTSPEGLSPTEVVVEAPDGTLSNLEENGGFLRSGGLGAGNHLALLAAGDDLPNLVMLSRPDGSVDQGDLQGLWHFTLLSPKDGEAAWGRVTFAGNGAGTLPAPADQNVNGTIGTFNLDSMAVQMQPNGSLLVTASPESGPDVVFAAVATDGGRLAMGSRIDEDGDAKPLLFAGVRAPQAADESLFAGRYWIAAYFSRRDSTTGDVSLGTLIGTVDADGAGGCTLDSTLHFGGSFQTFEDGSGSYAVAGDGTVHLAFLEFESVGGLDASGRYAVLGGSTLAGFHAHLVVLVRQPTLN